MFRSYMTTPPANQSSKVVWLSEIPPSELAAYARRRGASHHRNDEPSPPTILTFALPKPNPSPGGDWLQDANHAPAHLLRWELILGLEAWLASAEQWMQLCALIGLPVPPNFAIAYGTVKQAVEQIQLPR